MSAAGPIPSVAAQNARDALSRSELGRELLAMLDGVVAQDEATPLSKYASRPYLLAATRASYSLTDLPEAAPKELTPLLRDSLAVAGPTGSATRYVLTNPARRETIRAFAEKPELAAELEKACTSENAETRWLGELLRGGEAAADKLRDRLESEQRVAEVAAAAGALFKAQAVDERLEALASEARRRLDREEILSPLRILIGTRSAVGEGGEGDNFVGREQELEQLYAHVGVRPPATLRNRLRRLGKKISDTISSPKGALVIYGIGGMGKSSLVAKFVMEHARTGDNRLLFAYLDFDRTTLARANAAGLLVEIVRQVGLLGTAGPESIDKALVDLRDELRNLQVKTDERLISEQAHRFKTTVDAMSSLKTPFLLVLDSFERIQSQGGQPIRRVLALLQELGLFDGRWPQLRVVVCSRMDVPELRGNLESVKLGHFDSEGAEHLAERLLEARLGEAEAGWAKAIGQVSKGYPLGVRILTDGLAEAERAERPRIIADYRDAKADAVKIATIYYKRFAQRICAPGGLVSVRAAICLRTVTIPALDSALQVVAAHGIASTTGGGAQVSPPSATDVFEALRADPTLWAETAPDRLRWVPELRRLLLECMKEETPDLLRRVSARILQELQNAPENDEHSADLVYYGLLAGESVASVDTRSRKPVVRSLLNDAPDDFPQGSPEHTYLDVVTSGRPPTLADIERLPPMVAFRLIVAAEPTFVEVGGRNFDPRVMVLRRQILSKGGRLTEPFTSEPSKIFCLLVKVGAWIEAKYMPNISELIDANSVAALSFLAARTNLPKSMYRAFRGAINVDDLWGTPSACVHALVAARVVDSAAFERLDTSRVFETQSFERDKRVFLLAATFGEKAADWALNSFEKARSGDVDFDGGVSRHQCRLLESLEILPKAVAVKHFGEAYLSEASSFDSSRDYDLTRAVDDSLGRVKDLPRPIARPIMRAFSELRDPFWVEPLGYALARLYESGEVRNEGDWTRDARKIVARLATDHVFSRSLASRCTSPSILGDPVAFLFTLEEASALPAFIEAMRDRLENMNPSLILWINRIFENNWPLIKRVFGLEEKQLGSIKRVFERIQRFFGLIRRFFVLEEKYSARTEFLALAADYWRWGKTKAQITDDGRANLAL
jgi:AAA ATPase domain